MTDYCTLAQVKEHLPNEVWSNTKYDGLINALITRASRQFDRLSNRLPNAYAVAADTTMYYKGVGSNILLFDGTELAAAPTTLSVMEQAGTYTDWATTDYYLWPDNAANFLEPYRGVYINLDSGSKSTWGLYPRGVKVVGKHGFSIAVPPTVEEAVIMQVGRWLKRAQYAFQDKVQIIDKTPAFESMFQTDKDTINIIQNYRRTNL